MPFTDIDSAIAAIARGEFVIVVDDEDRENEGDLIMATQHVTPEAMGFMIRHTSGVICLPLEGERCDELQLPLMVSNNTEYSVRLSLFPSMLETELQPEYPQPIGRRRWRL